MSERLPQTANPFSAQIVGILVAVGLLTFTAIFAMLGWSPDLADKNRAGEHPYSTSALGYQGLFRLLEADGQTVTISRLAQTRGYAEGLLIIAIPRFGFDRLDDFVPSTTSEPTLYVLPKWYGRADRTKRSWQEDTGLLSSHLVSDILSTFDNDARVWRLRNPGQFSTRFGPVRPDFEHEMQVIDSDSLIPVISVPGGTLVSRVPGSEIYILSDPDVLNTFGIVRRENARFALGLIESLKPYPEAPITFDATIHGFERSENLLKAIFDIPFLGATLIAFATMLLIGWGAAIRFGPPQRETRAIAFGKQALADNSAGLITMARREGTMAPRYLEATRRTLIRHLGLPRQTDDATLTTTLNAIAKQRGIDSKFEDTGGPLTSDARTREDLTDKANRLWRWRKEITHGD